MIRLLSLTIIITLFATTPMHAAKLEKVKGSAVLINLEGETSEPGQEFFALDGGGKRKGIVRVSKVKGNKATGKLIKGKAESGWSLRARKAGGGSSSSSAAASSSSGGASSGKNYLGGILGFSSQSMSVKMQNDIVDSVSLSGNGLSLLGFYDFKWSPMDWMRSLNFRAIFGYFSFSTSSTTQSNTCILAGGDCKVNVNYIALGSWARYMLSEGNFKLWVGGSYSFVFPMSVDVTAVTESSVQSTSLFSFGGGADWQLGRNSYIPIIIEYGFFPPDSDVTASYFGLQIGYGRTF